jgi:hypothetical protein
MFSAIVLLAAMHQAEPPLSFDDLARFPPLEVAQANVNLANAHIAYIDFYAVTHGWGWGLREWREEARQARDCWQALVDAHRRDFTAQRWPVQGAQLRGLLTVLGARNYLQGAMPPPVPAHRFSRRD